MKVYQTLKHHDKSNYTADVEDSAKWEAGFRSHIDLLQSMSISKPIHFTTNEYNEVAICSEPDDLDKYLEVFNSPATVEAMAYDGVKHETVKVFFLNKELRI